MKTLIFNVSGFWPTAANNCRKGFKTLSIQACLMHKLIYILNK